MGQYKQAVWQAKREQAVHLRRLGYSYRQMAEALGTSKAWISKWLRRFATEGWEGLADRSRRPHRCPHRLPASVPKAVIRARSLLEAEAAKGEGLKFIGAPAFRTRLREQGVRPLASWAYRLLATAASRRLPLYAGRVHCIRRVEADGTVRVLNLRWEVPGAAIGQGVWVTLTLTPAAFTISRHMTPKR